MDYIRSTSTEESVGLGNWYPTALEVRHSRKGYESSSLSPTAKPHCAKCGLPKPLRKRRSMCNDCFRLQNAEWQRAWYAENKGIRKLYDRVKYLRKPACGKQVSIADYIRMSEIQGGVCAICERPPKKGRLYTDHCHVTGRVRGLLCPGCNTWLERKAARGYPKCIDYMAHPPAYNLNLFVHVAPSAVHKMTPDFVRNVREEAA